MRRFVQALAAVTWRDLRAWRLVLIAAALLGAVTYALPWLPLAARQEPEDMRLVAKVTVVILMAAALVISLGSRLASRDLAEGRIAFYFARPIPAGALWLGRLTAALVTTVSSLVLIVLPTLFFLDGPGGARARPLSALTESQWAAYLDRQVAAGVGGRLIETAVFFPGGLLLGLLVVHVVATLARHRDAWLLFDLIAVAGVGAIVSATVDELVSVQAVGPLVWVERGLLAWIVLVLTFAGGVQMAQGRSDPERGRRWLSGVTWTLLFAGAVTGFGFARWSTRAGLGSLVTRSVTAVSADGWLMLEGTTRYRGGHRAAFLHHPETQRTVRLGAVGVTRRSFSPSSDSTSAVWARCHRLMPADCELWTLNLEEPRPQPQATGLPGRPIDDRYVLADGGRFLVVHQRDGWSLYDLPRAKLLWRARQRLLQATFTAPDRLRFFQQVGDEVEVSDLDLGTGAGRLEPRLLTTFPAPASRNTAVSYQPPADLFAVWRSFPSSLSLYDAETGEFLVEHPGFQGGRHRFLPGGGMALVVWTRYSHTQDEPPFIPLKASLVILSGSGAVEHRVPLPGHSVRLAGVTASGRLLIGLSSNKAVAGVPVVENPLARWVLYEVDVASGEKKARIRGLGPMETWESRLEARREVLLWAARGAVVAWDTETGERRTILEELHE